MPNSMPTAPIADRNLLFGVLALQMDFISRDSLIAAMQTWIFDKNKSLGQILQDQGTLDEGERALLEPLVDKHLERHGGDPQRSLAVVADTLSVCHALSQITDADVQASIARTSQASDGLPETVTEMRPFDGQRFPILRPHAKSS
jgi:hypothetical protein